MSKYVAPLWSVCSVNDDVLSETTAKDYSFDYVDISSVKTGVIAEDLQRMRFDEAPSRARRLARPGDVIVSTVRTYLKAIAPVRASDIPRVYSTGFAVLRPSPEVRTDFFKYTLLSKEFIDTITAHSVGVSYPAINASELMRFHIHLPPPERQLAISSYLDRETAEIDAMDIELDRLVTLFQARRAAVSSSLHRLNHPLRKLKWVLSERDFRVGKRAHELPLLSVSIHHGVQLREESSSNQQASADLSNYKVAQAGELVLNRMRAFQGGLGVAPLEGLVSPDYSVLATQDGLTPEWAGYVMRSPEFIGEMSRSLRGIGSAELGNVRTPRINVRDLLDLEIPLPSLHEQHRIIERLDRDTAEIDAMITNARELKTLLAERRSTLITEAVTGQKEVA